MLWPQHCAEKFIMANALWTAQELVAATGGTLMGHVRLPLNGVAIDSRVIAAGDIFVAIKGDKMDGHDFVVNALKAGAGVAVVSHVSEEMKAAGPVLQVAQDPLRGLENMGRAARSWNKGKIVAVTGSVGKTSTKEMLRVALGASGETHASLASFNNHWGVPLTLARLPRQAAFGVFEIGMNHAGEITPLVNMVRPHVAIITTVAASHLGHFSSLDEIAKAKAEIFDGLALDGTAIINQDSPYFDYLAKAARAKGIKNIYGFGRTSGADVKIEQLALHATCCCVTAEVLGEKLCYKLGVPGEHMAMNSLAVLAAAKVMGADLARAALALAHAQPAKGRGVQENLQIGGGEFLLIDESYNANPASIAAALALLGTVRPRGKGRRVAVLGDMLELGEFGPKLHAEIAKDLDLYGVDILYAAGPLMHNLWQAAPAQRRGQYAATSAELKDILVRDVRADVVMIKGSLGSRMGLIVDALRAQFPAVKKES
jgi:UDP-N-acetylmuramoyl-tripeptide--D-alanyl-D-alanine ligase